MQRADVVVVGGGVMGAAAAWRLSLAGRPPVVLERFQVGHDRGSSHGPSRVFRLSYGDPTYVRMAMEALPLWQELEAQSGRTILSQVGQIDWGQRYVEQNQAAMRLAGAPFELLDADEANRRYPVAIPSGQTVLFHGQAGIVHAERSVRTFLDMATAGGAELHEGTPVRELRPAHDGVEVVIDTGGYRASAVVVTAGPWIKPLAASAGIDLPVIPSLESVAFFSHPDQMSLPVLVEWAVPIRYGLPDPGRGIKIGAHHTGPDADPDGDVEADSDLVEMLTEWAVAHYPKADPNTRRTETCFYTNTSDERFIVERHGPVVIGSACSGHGFKFAPLIGDRLARLAIG